MDFSLSTPAPATPTPTAPAKATTRKRDDGPGGRRARGIPAGDQQLREAGRQYDAGDEQGAEALVSLSIATYLNNPSDVVKVNVQFARIPGGPNHVNSETIDGVSKQLTITVQNSNYQHQ
jgi:hypothetical protein